MKTNTHATSPFGIKDKLGYLFGKKTCIILRIPLSDAKKNIQALGYASAEFSVGIYGSAVNSLNYCYHAASVNC